MATQVQFRGGTTAEHASFNGAAREVTVDTTKQTLVVQDGTTNGGYPLLRENGSQDLTTTGDSTFKGAVDIANATGGVLTLSTTDTSVQADELIGKINFYTSDPSGDGPNNSAIIAARAEASIGNGAYITFATSVADTGTEGAEAIERMRVDYNGRVGIGTQNPNSELEISKAGSAANCKLEITQSGGGGGTSEILFSDAVSGRGRIFFDHGASPEALNLEAAGTIGLTVTTAGKTGINKIDPSTALDVNGEISLPFNNTLRWLESDGTVASDIYTNSGNTLIFRNNSSTQTASLDTSGNLELAGNLSVANTNGIDFSATTDSSGMSQANQSELLDDYEEGEYIPSVSSNITLNTSYHWWSYTKIGRQVTIKGLFICQAISGTDAIEIGIPFSAATLPQTANAGPGATMWTQVTGATAGVSSYIQNGGSHMRLYLMTEGTGGWVRLANNDISTSTEIYVTHTYWAA